MSVGYMVKYRANHKEPMTFSRVEVTSRIAGRNRTYNKSTLYLVCDNCNIEYKCPENTKNRCMETESHYCSRKCLGLARQNENSSVNIKSRATMMERYGKPYYTETDELINHNKTISLEKWGVDSPLKAPEVIEKIKKTNLERYGQETFAGSKEWNRKYWQTRLKNDNFNSSQEEDKMYQILLNHFLFEDIERQFPLNTDLYPLSRYRLDFYIKSFKLYIQVDGRYWHGLDRPLEQIQKLIHPHDYKICQQYVRDREVDRFCQEESIKLLRITDKEMRKMTETEIMNKIMEKK